MQTSLDSRFKETEAGKEADKILRKCVHCGFCNAVCPTYQLSGNELEGPRGRIYIIKNALEGNQVSFASLSRLDHCLTCLSCESTCPSGVNYHQLLNIGREWIEKNNKRPLSQRIFRNLLCRIIPNKPLLKILLSCAKLLKPLLPSKLKAQVPTLKKTLAWPDDNLPRSMILHQGCIQPLLSPETNQVTAEVFSKLGIKCIPEENNYCCGALHYHSGKTQKALQIIRNNIDAWLLQLDKGAECIVSTASGCGWFIKDYKNLLKDDPAYAQKALQISLKCKDVAEVMVTEKTDKLEINQKNLVAYHAPCSLQHGQKASGHVEKLLADKGLQLLIPEDPHLCCGSAGTYSLYNPGTAGKLQKNKLNNLMALSPEIIVTANIGCQLHLGKNSRVKITHWIELFR